MARPFTWAAAARVALSWVCPNGHANLDSSPYCTRCAWGD